MVAFAHHAQEHAAAVSDAETCELCKASYCLHCKQARASVLFSSEVEGMEGDPRLMHLKAESGDAYLIGRESVNVVLSHLVDH